MKSPLNIFSRKLIIALLILIFCSIPSIIVLKLVDKEPKIAVIDLLYLNDGFVSKLSSYLAKHKLSNEVIAKIIKSHLSSLEAILDDIQKNSDYLLLQKQAVISSNVKDITRDVEKILFEAIIKKTNRAKKRQLELGRQFEEDRKLESDFSLELKDHKKSLIVNSQIPSKKPKVDPRGIIEYSLNLN